ncbi:hypothetical protein ppKF707_0111 [Metapseudomonas furukawaii]|uniref:Uncharacterized protein n=1 Tax=Metapseudomonas furukawaii TaxID=1149133 RepID=A0AAD1C583_METFU|nr:hypothetical protein ppKF707_0111 [Pseudomonas furukawaii]BAU76473.1 hypothetical protein KF707C_47850 [Pseudomonas furukawaii]
MGAVMVYLVTYGFRLRFRQFLYNISSLYRLIGSNREVLNV